MLAWEGEGEGEDGEEGGKVGNTVFVTPFLSEVPNGVSCFGSRAHREDGRVSFTIPFRVGTPVWVFVVCSTKALAVDRL